MQTPQYIVGIDLGTTHTVVAYAELSANEQTIQLFEIEQLVALGEVATKPLLPSVRYHPAEGEVSAEDIIFSASGETAVIGEAARLLGSKTQGRLVSSAKSWLSHPSVDHTADILPWGAKNDEITKVSPLDASASYLAHIRMVWNHQFPKALLEHQELVITVPASFDEGARSLTLEAARIAGLKKLRLLEEPQAVFYDWLRRHKDNLQTALAGVNLLLVCDVGGGTTDLTLIKVEQGEKEPKLTRIGVGDHLMLGGDNVDLTLAHLAEKKLNQGDKRLSTADLSQLLEQCRVTKERLLGENAPEQLQVTLLGGGSKLIGGTRSVVLSREEVREIALEGFFPLSSVDELPDKKRSGVVEFGLPYAAEPAVSKHIAAFLKLHQQVSQQATSEGNGIPDAILLNGGVFRSKILSQRTLDLLASWRSKPPKQLKNAYPELAVAYGAVSYAMARHGKQLKIGGGSARSYFLLIDSDKKDQQQGVCILPRGSEEGEELLLKNQQFALRLGQPVQFHLASLTGDSHFEAGQLVEVIDEAFHSLPPLAVAFENQQASTNTEVIVQLAVTLTEVGTLKIQCVSINDNQQRWDVEFQIRRKTKLAENSALPVNFSSAIEKIQGVFGSKSKQINPKAVKSLRADLEKILGLRADWETPLLRELFAILLENSKNRRRSENHERVWLSLSGYCLRPGFGYPLDDWRVEQLWNAYSQGIQFVNETQHWSEWWTLWRRIAGGLSIEAQQKIFADISKYLNPVAVRQGGITKQLKTRSYDDIVRLAAVLERLPVDNKIQLGEWLLKRLQKTSEPNQTWWAIGRIASRVPFHGSSHNVIAVDIVNQWLSQIMVIDWRKIPQAGFAAMLIARKSGDRERDLEESIRQQIIDKLKTSKSPSSWIDIVENVRELDAKQEQQVFGEALPPGLKLIV